MNTIKLELENKLSNGIWLVIFEKRDGTIRRMICTRDFDSITRSSNWSPPLGKRSAGRDQVIVWDLEKNMWRSFRASSLISANKTKQTVDEFILNDQDYDPTVLLTKLSSGIYKLEYETLAGIIHQTYGTRDPEYMPKIENTDSNFKRSRRIPSYQIIYWDLIASGWRLFRSFALKSIMKVNSIDRDVNENIGIPQNILSKNLESNAYKVTFIKRDGSLREMNCDRFEDHMKDFDGEVYSHIIPVYDRDKQDFRNIRYNSILSVEKIDE